MDGQTGSAAPYTAVGEGRDAPSPTKRRKVEPAPSSLPPCLDAGSASSPAGAAVGQASGEHIPLQTRVPAPVTLLALAVSLRATAQSLLPSLAKRPSSASASSQARYAQSYAEYVRAAMGAVAVLRAAVQLTAGASEFSGGRVELRANAMLGETLVDLYEGSGNEKVVAPEAEKAVSRAHPSLAPYVPPVTLLQLRLSLFSSKPLKFIRTTLRRLITSLTSSTPSPALSAATYAAHALTASIPGATVEEKLSAWATVHDLAQQRGDEQVRVVAALGEARLALDAEDYVRASQALGGVHTLLGVDVEGEAQKRVWAPRLLKVQYRLLYCLLKSQVGEAKAARDMLKSTHKLLDAVVATTGGEDAGDEVTFKIPSQSEMYTFAFLASAALYHHEPSGKSPRAQLFGEEGIRIVDQKLNGREVSLPVTSLPAISTSLRRHAALKTRLHLILSALGTMRSAYSDAEKHVHFALHAARAYASSGDTLVKTQIRATLEWAQVRIARAARDGVDEREAETALEGVLAAIEAAIEGSDKGGGVRGAGGAQDDPSPQLVHLQHVAMLSLLLLRMSALPDVLTSAPLTPTATLLRTLTAPSVSAPSASAASRLVSALATALSVPSITASKTALSSALSLTNSMQAMHARAGVLALLGNVFLWTREGEAQKMLHSALRLAQAFGNPAQRSVSLDDGQAALPVGHARLSLWLGEKLLESYRVESRPPPDAAQRIAAQERANSACRRMLEVEARQALGQDKAVKMES
ncbi:hypothetical protein Rhopal_000048-T1 [Rhodotorula paludigena]|uniref:Cohesin loading factor n=1 Tax=Rhodotorula paludigena TaxID=86838 RepID=A0AAV5GAJ3_9BASI|nr:hypothetical protein Rhopal_000048-T1 [Rhodotorula paludigena]